MKATTIELKAPYRGFGYITIPKGTKVAMQRRTQNGEDYHEVIDIDLVMQSASEMTEEERKDFFRAIVYHPIRVPAKYVQ